LCHKIKEIEHIIEELGEWQGVDPNTGFHLVKTNSGKIIKVADLVDDDPKKKFFGTSGTKKFQKSKVTVISVNFIFYKGYN
jgi:hypothetical protein